VLTERETAQLEGAKNLWRYNRGDLTNVAIYVVVLAGLFVACWLLAHAIFLLPHANPQPIHYGHVVPARNFPIYRPGPITLKG
jgi:hypothetical protein